MPDPPLPSPRPESLQAGIEALRRGLDELEQARTAQETAARVTQDIDALGHTFLESAPEAVLIVDRQGRLLLVNRRAETLFGYDRGELIGQPIEILLPESLRAVHERHREEYFAHPRTRSMGQGLELAGRRKDGSMFPVEISLGHTEMATGPQAMAFVTDITERKRIEEALRRSEVRARALLESAAEGIVITDRTGRIVSMNAKAGTLFGYEPRELVGQPLETLLPARLRDLHGRHRDGYFAHPQVRPMGRGLDLVALRKDSSEFPVEIALSHIDTEEGVQAVAFVTDITARLAVERASRQADRLAAVGTLAAGIAHEINNPIGIMTSRIELILLDAEEHHLPASVVEDLRVLHRNATRVARIAESLLSFTRVSSEQRGPVDLDRVVAETLRLVESQMGKQGIHIVTTLAEGLPPVLGHLNALEQVLLNLLTNARDAMAGKGEIRIETGRVPDRPECVYLKVADEGPGISPEALPRVFDPFYTTKPSGTGLGLSVTYGIVHDHNGTIDVQSAPGQGTTFVLTFPVIPPHPA